MYALSILRGGEPFLGWTTALVIFDVTIVVKILCYSHESTLMPKTHIWLPAEDWREILEVQRSLSKTFWPSYPKQPSAVSQEGDLLWETVPFGDRNLCWSIGQRIFFNNTSSMISFPQRKKNARPYPNKWHLGNSAKWRLAGKHLPVDCRKFGGEGLGISRCHDVAKFSFSPCLL